MPPTMGSDRLFLTYSEAATEAHFSELCAMPILVGKAAYCTCFGFTYRDATLAGDSCSVTLM